MVPSDWGPADFDIWTSNVVFKSSASQHVEKMIEITPVLISYERLKAVQRWFIIQAGRSVVDGVRTGTGHNADYLYLVYERRTHNGF